MGTGPHYSIAGKAVPYNSSIPSEWDLPIVVQVFPFLIQLTAKGLEKVAEDGPNVWVPDTHMDEALASCLLALAWPCPGGCGHLKISLYNSDFEVDSDFF